MPPLKFASLKMEYTPELLCTFSCYVFELPVESEHGAMKMGYTVYRCPTMLQQTTGFGANDNPHQTGKKGHGYYFLGI